jgi:hypothetical protein
MVYVNEVRESCGEFPENPNRIASSNHDAGHEPSV